MKQLVTHESGGLGEDHVICCLMSCDVSCDMQLVLV